MVFSSVTFLFLFLPVILVLVWIAGRGLRNHVLLGGSLLFYAWGEGAFCLLLVASVLVNYLLGRVIGVASGGGRKGWLALGVILNLVPLFLLKYAGFAVESLNAALGTDLLPGVRQGSVHLPAGISFFTFQAISYLADIHRRIVPAEKRMVNCGLYISMFPQLIAGPIIRYHDIARQLVRRTVNRPLFAGGAERFIHGLGKKVLLADPLGMQADRIFLLPAADLSTPVAWLGAICFALQIYYDFSGYSDMAIGLGRMFGFTFPENFNYPYISRSMREFWRRWHISLSTWLRDYLYIPLGGNRRGTARTLANLLVVFVLCGLWHGANWTFVAWGLWHGLFLVIERLVPARNNSIVAAVGGWCYTSLVVLTGWVVFRSASLTEALEYLRVMAGIGGAAVSPLLAELMNDSLFRTELAAGLVLATPVFQLIRERSQGAESAPMPTARGAVAMVARDSFRLLVFCVVGYFSALTIAARAYQPFLYFQF